MLGAPKKNPRQFGMGLKVPSLRWVREGQTLSAGDAEATIALCDRAVRVSVGLVQTLRNRL